MRFNPLVLKRSEEVSCRRPNDARVACERDENRGDCPASPSHKKIVASHGHSDRHRHGSSNPGRTNLAIAFARVVFGFFRRCHLAVAEFDELRRAWILVPRNLARPADGELEAFSEIAAHCDGNLTRVRGTVR